MTLWVLLNRCASRQPQRVGNSGNSSRVTCGALPDSGSIEGINLALYQSLARTARIAQRRASRAVSARSMMLKSGRSLDRVHYRANGFPVLARIDRGLRLPEQKVAAASTVVGLLTQNRIPYFKVPVRDSARTHLAVLNEDRAEVLKALGDSTLEGWYRDRLDSRGQLCARWERPGDRLPDTVPGVVIWEFVVGDPASTFCADETQGVRIEFWLPKTQGNLPVMAAPLKNGRLEVVAADEFRTASADVLPHMTDVDFPIDVVYTWVDGSDSDWQAAKLRASGQSSNAEHTERAQDEARFADHDELRISLRSIEQFAPWVRNIWIVTAGQRPFWLVDHPRVRVVDHRDIWPDDVGLPTFNSHAIEACLHRISGLAEHFLYFNDDMILGRPVAPELFFEANGLTKFFWSKALVDCLPLVAGEIASTSAGKNARQLIAAAGGVTFSQKFYHAPYPLRVSVLRQMESAYPEEFARTRRAIFRTTSDVAVAGSFYFNYAYVSGRAVPGLISYEYIDPATRDGIQRLEAVARNRDFDTFCINDGASDQSTAQRAASDAIVRSFLAAYLPVAAHWERSNP